MQICGSSFKNLLIHVFDIFMLHTMYSTSFTKLEESNKTIQRSAISKCWRKLGIHGNRFDSTNTIVWKLLWTTFLQQVNLQRWTILVKCYTKWRKQTNKQTWTNDPGATKYNISFFICCLSFHRATLVRIILFAVKWLSSKFVF